ncbi:winged helix-turn-helix domain-containing protein (plasmid) [Isosphaeraceae bacterium EP7]
MATTRSAQELENRRRLAVVRVNDGYAQTEVARFLGVNVRSVRRWIAAHRAEGEAGLAASTAPGQAPRLTPEQGQIALGWLGKPATELWTAPRIAQLMEKTFAVKYHPRYLNEWLTARGITPQKPRRVPRERDQAEIDRWVAEDLPRIKKRSRGMGPTSS